MFDTLKVKTTTPLKEVLLSLPDGDLWEDAKVLECLDYVLKSKLLKVPEEYKDVFPRLFVFGRGWSCEGLPCCQLDPIHNPDPTSA